MDAATLTSGDQRVGQDIGWHKDVRLLVRISGHP
jgi:hypothetical protein